MIAHGPHARNDAQPRDRSAREWPPARFVGTPLAAAPVTWNDYAHGGLSAMQGARTDVAPHGSPASGT